MKRIVNWSLDEIKKILNSENPLEALLNTCDESDNTALHWVLSIDVGRAEFDFAARTLLQFNNKLLDATNASGNTPLHTAAETGRCSCIAFAIQNLSSEDRERLFAAKNNNGETPGEVAVRLGKKESFDAAFTPEIQVNLSQDASFAKVLGQVANNANTLGQKPFGNDVAKINDELDKYIKELNETKKSQKEMQDKKTALYSILYTKYGIIPGVIAGGVFAGIYFGVLECTTMSEAMLAEGIATEAQIIIGVCASLLIAITAGVITYKCTAAEVSLV